MGLGIPALLVNYNFSGANNQMRDSERQNNNNYYLNLRSGINWGARRLRNYSIWNHYTGGSSSGAQSTPTCSAISLRCKAA